MSFFKEFKEFTTKGNVMDMAVGVIIGGAFGKIVTSLVTDVIMPPIGLALGGIDFKDIAIVLKEATASTPAVSMKLGMFFNTILEFLIIALVIFFVVKLMNRLKREHEEEKPAEPPAPTASELLLTDIRDLLKTKA